MKKPGRNRNRHMTEPWEEDGQKKKSLGFIFVPYCAARVYSVPVCSRLHSPLRCAEKLLFFSTSLSVCVCVFF